MCMVSVLMTNWKPQQQRDWQQIAAQMSPVSRHEFDALRKEVLELKELIRAAKRFDAMTGQPDCEDAAKFDLLRRIAAALNIDIADVAPAVAS